MRDGQALSSDPKPAFLALAFEVPPFLRQRLAPDAVATYPCGLCQFIPVMRWFPYPNEPLLWSVYNNAKRFLRSSPLEGRPASARTLDGLVRAPTGAFGLCYFRFGTIAGVRVTRSSFDTPDESAEAIRTRQTRPCATCWDFPGHRPCRG